ncbi:hypothetical protein N9Z53_02380 [Mariniblastus sp.]|jgi:hypothetical protein|nr:hypothetical protein [Mariniblastus sp.]
MPKVWKPQCVDPSMGSDGRTFGTSSQGYLTPCCWVDFSFYKDLDTLKEVDPKLAILFQEHLKLKNNECIEDILFSDEWIEFHNSLLTGPDNVSNACKKYCYTNINNSVKKEKIYSSVDI